MADELSDAFEEAVRKLKALKKSKKNENVIIRHKDLTKLIDILTSVYDKLSGKK